MMNRSVLDRLDRGARCVAPSAVTVMLVMLSIVPLQIPHYGSVAPMFGLMGIYYWAIHRPDLMPFSIVFVIGLLYDALTGAPLGIASFVLLLCYWMVCSQRRLLVGKSFIVVWWGFMVVAICATALEWLLFSILAGAVMPVRPALFQSLMTMAVFPAAAWIFIQVHRSLPQDVE